VVLPAALTPAQGCRGRVAIRVRRGRRFVTVRRARVTRTCRYSARVRIRRGRRVQARFTGNPVARARSSRTIRKRR
jgi:hypothetical protein